MTKRKYNKHFKEQYIEVGSKTYQRIYMDVLRSRQDTAYFLAFNNKVIAGKDLVESEIFTAADNYYITRMTKKDN